MPKTTMLQTDVNHSFRWQQAAKSLILASSLTATCPVSAENDSADTAEKRQYHVDGGSLSHVLSQFAGSAGILLSADARLTDGKQSEGLEGNYTVAEGFQKLLAGTGLVQTATDEHTVTLKVAEINRQTDASTLSAVKVTGQAIYDSTDPYNKDYAVPDSFAATKTDTPIMQTPMNIQVVPKSLLNDQQDITLIDAITKNVSGVQADHGSGNIYDTFIIRGFANGGDVFRNGLLRGFGGVYDPVNMERIEVIKGPASMLYGRAQPGGLINYVTKKGLDIPYYSVQQQIGSYDQYRTTAEATGPIDKDRTLRYRLNFAYQDIGSFKQFIQDERYFLAPTLSWRPNDRFEANLELEYKHEKKVDDWGIPSIGNRPAPVPLSRSYQDSAKGPEIDNVLVAYDWAFKFNDQWKLKNRFLWENWDIEYYDVATNKLQADNRTLDRFLITGPANQETFATNLDLAGKFDWLGTEHEVLLGGDYYHNSFDGFNERFTFGTPVVPPIDIFNPVYNVVNQAAVDALPFDWHFLRRQDRYGIYFQDQITLFDKLHILGGGRYDWVSSGTGFSTQSEQLAKAGFSDQEDQKFSPRVGILYQPWRWLSLYGSYTESLGSPNSGTSFTGQSFKPQEGEQYEAGFKTEFFDRRFSSTVSFYHLTKTNTLTNDPLHPTFSVTAGKARSRGIEVDLKGQITEQLNLVTTYAFTDIRFIQANEPLIGQRPINVPEHQASLWGTYQLTDNFKIGLGGITVSKRLGDNSNPVILPGYVRMDAMAAYSLPVGKTRLTTQVNITNLLDKDYYIGTGGGRNNITTGNPISVMGLVKLEY